MSLIRLSPAIARRVAPAVLLLGVLLVSACGNNMRDQARYEPYEPTDFFDDQLSARQPPENSVARGQLRDDAHLNTGKGQDGEDAAALPFPLTEEVLLRGQNRYNIYCAPCHAQTGNGQGMVVQRGFRPPPSLHQQRLRDARIGHFFDVMTNGFGAMPPYADVTSAEDRWAIAAYIRALQLSQNATIEDVPEEQRGNLGGGEGQ